MNLKRGSLLVAALSLVILFQNCGEFRAIEPEQPKISSSVADLVLEAATNEVVKAEPFSVAANLNKFGSGFQFQWSHDLDDQPGACTQAVSADSARVSITCPDGGVIRVTFFASDAYGNTYSDQLRFLVNFERQSAPQINSGEMPPAASEN